MDREYLDKEIRARMNWLHRMALMFHRRFPKLDPDDIFSDVQETLWDVLKQKLTPNGENIRSVEGITYKVTNRKLFDRTRRMIAEKRWIGALYSDFYHVTTSDVVSIPRNLNTFLKPCARCGLRHSRKAGCFYDEPKEQNKQSAPISPCSRCGTTGGRVKRKNSLRVRGMCQSCYDRSRYSQRKLATYKI